MSLDGDLEISNRTWNKVVSNVHKEGFREGASDGHEKSFQKGFDHGFSLGFQRAEKMGIVNGILRAIKDLNLEKTKDFAVLNIEGPAFESSYRGLCVMCPNSLKLNDNQITRQAIVESSEKYNSFSLQDVLQEQEKSFNENFSRITEIYQPIIGGVNDLLTS